MFEYAHRISLWAASLNADSAWVEAINEAFDAVGFTEDYVQGCRARRANNIRIKAVKDHVWGMIELDPDVVWLLDCPLLQRLRTIHQLGFSSLTYPNAQHTRFEHSLGVYHVVCRLIDSFEITHKAETRNSSASSTQKVEAVAIGEKETRLIKHAALLHDIGHAAFSHVSEKAFVLRRDTWRLGPYTVNAFLKDFSAHYHGLKGQMRRVDVRERDFSEILAVAIITSNRFKRFYKKCAGLNIDDVEADLYDISALIFGDRTSANNLALPEILSGPVDADKIDYLVRDAHACGISLSIDISRVFLRAGIYQVNDIGLLPNSDKLVGLDEGPVTIFVIDQSGSDAVRELGMSRLSLYTRVYHHQLTRNAEIHFREMLDAAASGERRSKRKYSDFLKLWALPEQVLLHNIAGHARSQESRELARSLLNRDLLKRAACLDHNMIRWPLPRWLDQVPGVVQAIDIEIQNTFDDLTKRVNHARSNKALCQRIIKECATIRAMLTEAGITPEKLPSESEPHRVSLLPFTSKEESQPPSAYVMSADRRITKPDSRLQSYVHAGEIPERRSFLLVPREWREIAAISFQKVLFTEYARNYQADLTLAEEDFRSDATVKVTRALTLKGLHRPAQDLLRSCHESKVHRERLKEYQGKLISKGYYDDTPVLYPEPEIDPQIKQISQKFQQFEGEFGWRIDPDGTTLRAFLTQFPPRLRQPTMVLLDSMSNHFLDRKTTVEYVFKALELLPPAARRTIRLVPLTPSSGHRLHTYLQPELRRLDSSLRFQLCSSIHDALDRIGAGERIVFFDDNIVSGTQACKQVEALIKGRSPSPANIFHAKLNKQAIKRLREAEVAFVFAVGAQKGLEKLFQKARELGLRVCDNGAAFGKDLTVASGRTTTDPDLRTFLDTVGLGVMIH